VRRNAEIEKTRIHNIFVLFLAAYPSIHNGLTFCAGSFASRADNDVVKMLKDEKMAEKVNFVHLRNVQKDENGGFAESDHLTGDVDFYQVMKLLINERQKRIDRKESEGDWLVVDELPNYLILFEKLGFRCRSDQITATKCWMIWSPTEERATLATR